MLLNFIKNKKIALLGIGRSTLSAYKFLFNKGFDLYIWDDNPIIRNKYKDSSFNIVNIYKWDYTSLDAIITSPGIALYHPEKHALIEKIELYNIPLLSDLELFYCFFPNYKYIGVTGSNGKSSLVTLLNDILCLSGNPSVLAGNIGIPIFSLQKLALNTYIIIEVSSFQSSFFKNMHFDIAVLLNICPNHNDYHGNYLNYQQAKFNIFKNQNKNDKSIVNLDDEYADALFNTHNGVNSKVTTVSSKGKINADLFFSNGILYKNNSNYKDDIKLIYNFNSEFNVISNNFLQLILFTYAICDLLQIDINILLKALKSFKGLPHRQEIIAIKNNIIFINDSKATTAEAAATALERYDNIYWLIGGIRKSGNISACEPFYKKIKHVFIFGRDKDRFVSELKNNVSFSCYNNLKDAILAAFNSVKNDLTNIDSEIYDKNNKTKVVLLSPIGTSFDEFNNFEHRGNYFKQIIMELINATI